MSELQSYLTPTPASVPIITRGNAFWRNGERFLIKGISYLPRRPDHDGQPDPLTDDRLEELKQDIDLFHELGLNSISVRGLNPTEDHSNALKLLEKEGIYVMVHIRDTILPPKHPHIRGRSTFDENSDPAAYYTLHIIKDTLSLINQLADHPNVLSLAVDARVEQPALPLNAPLTKLATVHRALIRDAKAFLQARKGREVPVGISIGSTTTHRLSLLQYFSAGEPTERADYFAMECYSWAGKSSFQISGWKDMVGELGRASPIPMLLSAYSNNVMRPNRAWDEVLCLYSLDMTGVFSGGFAFTFSDHVTKPYGVVGVGADGQRQRRQGFYSLKEKSVIVDARSLEEVGMAEDKDYEKWRGEFPDQQERSGWFASPNMLAYPGDWEQTLTELKHEKQ